jgi:Caspase domain
MKACVAIGIDRVGQIPALAELRDAADGAERFHKWAVAEGYESELLTDRKGPVTMTAILSKIAAFVDRGPELLIVYFAGHGILKAADWEQWLLSEAASNVNEAVNFEATVAIARLSQIPHLVFISDACRALSADDILSQVSGSVVFPPRRRQRGQLQPQVDLFYATAPGDTSLEVPAEQANGDYRALFTRVLLDGLAAVDASVIETVDDPTGKIRVVSSRTLAPYLEREVPREAIKVNITFNQTPDIRPLSRPPKYLAVVKAAAAPAPEFPPAPPPGPPPPPAPSVKLERLAAEHGLGYYFQAEDFAVQEPGPPGDERFNADMTRLMKARGRPSFETETGFTVIGTPVVEAVFNGQPVANSDVFEEPGTQGINIRLDRGEPARSILLQFGSETGTCLAVLPQFIGTVVVEGARWSA